jgi:hypothetical protein
MAKKFVPLIEKEWRICVLNTKTEPDNYYPPLVVHEYMKMAGYTDVTLVEINK